ncbi:MAG: glycoside hydrolase domain-containing protein [Pseudomonadota bacterium]
MARSPIIDTPFNTTAKATALRGEGIETVIRYYNFRNSNTFPDKCLTAEEAQALTAAGLNLVAVFQQRQNRASDFSRQIGLRAGRRAHELAADKVGQPSGSAIYFAVDFDASADEIDTLIKPYFEGVRESLAAEGGGTPQYRVGAYGSGLLGKTLTAAGLIELTWLSMSSGFRGTRDALAAGDWHLHQFFPATTLLGLGVDFDESNPAKPDFGSFTVEEEEAHDDLVPPDGAGQGMPMEVKARSGLRLRAGPGTNFDIIGLLPFGSQVTVQEIVDGWAKVDRDGDGAVDGFAFASFLNQA